jgi:hypothetical protein
MKPMDVKDLMAAWCALTGKYAMMISLPEANWYDCFLKAGKWNYGEFFDHLMQAAPYLLSHEDEQDTMGGIMSDNIGVLTFDTEDEMALYYKRTVGDDGALDRRCNKYDGPVHVYAMTCGPEGWRNENT